MNKTLNRVNAVMAALGSKTDYDVIHDIYLGTVEPGYGGDDTVLVSGNWNSKRRYNESPTWASEHPVRLGNALESVGAELVWMDEWAQCAECYRVVRTEPDSYIWKPSYIWVDDCGIVCAECVRKDVESVLGEFINNPNNAFPFDVSFSELGFEPWEPHNHHVYETGFHSGQDDKPQNVLDDIHHLFPNAEVVFSIDHVGQFDVRWLAHFRQESD